MAPVRGFLFSSEFIDGVWECCLTFGHDVIAVAFLCTLKDLCRFIQSWCACVFVCLCHGGIWFHEFVKGLAFFSMNRKNVKRLAFALALLGASKPSRQEIFGGPSIYSLLKLVRLHYFVDLQTSFLDNLPLSYGWIVGEVVLLYQSNTTL